MGGYNSGRWHAHTPKQQVENGVTFSVFDLTRIAGRDAIASGKGAYTLTWSIRDKPIASIGAHLIPNGVRLEYIQNGSPMNERITLIKTPCYFGGFRYWMLCPECENQVAKLYNVGRGFKCRQCQNLTYASVQRAHEYETGSTRGIIQTLNADAKLDKLYKKLVRARYGSKRFEALRKQIQGIGGI